MFKKIIYSIVLIIGAIIFSFFGVINNVFALTNLDISNNLNVDNQRQDFVNQIVSMYPDLFIGNGWVLENSNNYLYLTKWDSLTQITELKVYSLNGSNYAVVGAHNTASSSCLDQYRWDFIDTNYIYMGQYCGYYPESFSLLYNFRDLNSNVSYSTYNLDNQNLSYFNYSSTGLIYSSSSFGLPTGAIPYDSITLNGNVYSNNDVISSSTPPDPFENYTKYTFTDNQLLLNAPVNDPIEIYLPYGVVETTGTTINLYRKDNDLLVGNLPLKQFDVVQMGQDYYYKIDTTILDPNYYIMLTKNTGSYNFYTTANITNYNKYSAFNILTLSGNTQYLLKGTDTIGKLLIDKNTFNTNNMKLYIYDRELNIVLEKLVYKSYDNLYYYVDLNFNAFKDLELYIGIDTTIQFDLLINNNWNSVDLPATPIGVPTDQVEKEKQNFFDNINNFINDNIEGINKFKEFLSLLYTNLPTLVRTIISFVYSLTWVKLLVGVIKS